MGLVVLGHGEGTGEGVPSPGLLSPSTDPLHFGDNGDRGVTEVKEK